MKIDIDLLAINQLQKAGNALVYDCIEILGDSLIVWDCLLYA